MGSVIITDPVIPRYGDDAIGGFDGIATRYRIIIYIKIRNNASVSEIIYRGLSVRAGRAGCTVVFYLNRIARRGGLCIRIGKGYRIPESSYVTLLLTF